MPGLRIVHYLFDVHYIEPTRIYAMVQLDNGDLKLDKIYENKVTLEELPLLWQSLEIKRPVALIDKHPRIVEEFKRKGIRVL